MKKAQEEIVGFVLIVVIVSILMVVFLGILLRKPAVISENLDVSQFLDSMLEYNTKCAIGYVPRYASVGELMGYCYEGRLCVSGEKSCAVLNESINEIISSSWLVDEGSYYSGYDFDSVYMKNNRTYSIASTAKGNCTLYRGADNFFEHQGGVITSTIKICTRS